MLDIETAVGVPLFVLDPGGVSLITGGSAFNPTVATYQRGQSFELTEDLIRLNTDAKGNCSLLWDEDEQLLRWNKIRLVPGAWPTGEPVLIPGSPEALLQRERERAEAWKHLSGFELNNTLKALDARYGRPQTSAVLAKSKGDSSLRYGF